MTRADLRARVRRELGDGEAVRLWTDDQVHDALADAVRELAYELPRAPVSVTVTTVAGQQEYVVGADWIAVVGVEQPPGQPVAADHGPPGAFGGGSGGQDDGYRQGWTAQREAGTVRLRLAPATSGEGLRIWLVPPLAPPADDTTPAPIEADEEAIVAMLACRSLWEARQVADAKRGLRTPGGNPYARRAEAMLARRKRRVRMASAQG